MARYLLLGHLTRDLIPEEGFRFGGAVLYAGLTVRRLGFETHIVTSCAEREEELEALFPELFIHVQSSPETTTFENRETPLGRKQWVHARACSLDLTILSPDLYQTDILHLAPVLDEVPPEESLLRNFRFRWLVANPQGWFRGVRIDGTVHPIRPDLSRAPRFHALVVSVEDLAADPSGLLAELKEKSRYLVLTRGAEGAELFFEGRSFFLSARKVAAKDTTGAGDILAGVFFGLLSFGEQPLEALRIAMDVAARSVTRTGLSGVPRREELTPLLEKHSRVYNLKDPD